MLPPRGPAYEDHDEFTEASLELPHAVSSDASTGETLTVLLRRHRVRRTSLAFPVVLLRAT